MGGGNGQKSRMAREKHLEKQKVAKGSQLESNKKAMTIQTLVRREWELGEKLKQLMPDGKGQLHVSIVAYTVPWTLRDIEIYEE